MRRVQERSQQGADRAITRRLLRCGAIAGPLFVATFFGRRSYPSRLRPTAPPGQLAGVGIGWLGAVAQLHSGGGLYVAGSVGLSRARTAGSPRTGPVLIGAAAVGLLGAGAFLTDPVSGYPPGTPAAPTSYSTSGALHNLLSLLFSDYQQQRWSTRATSDAAASRVGRRIQPEPVQPCSPSPPLPASFSIRHPLWWPMEACSSGPPSPPASPG